MNKHCMVVLWVMVQSEMEKSLEPMYLGLAHPYRVPDPGKTESLNWDAWKTVDAIIAEATSGVLQNTCLYLFHCLRRLLREFVSEHHALYSSVAKFLSAAFCLVELRNKDLSAR
ncbi:hypothetical protein Q7C36_007483 [Tachysurus vachellii]|uniref:Uncharacterized protein n=1 Tax=Tachysurus vachellii TaxID=175792 RepID=A0AA88N8L8_TACVA|nr:hypothetical protein Q7C36_007483 [Tachysurus vachellii]